MTNLTCIYVKQLHFMKVINLNVFTGHYKRARKGIKIGDTSRTLSLFRDGLFPCFLVLFYFFKII